MPFRFFFGGKKETDQTNIQENIEDDEFLDELSNSGSIRYAVDYNEVYFMNPNFGSSFRSPSTSPMPGLTHRTYTRRLSSRAREYQRLPSDSSSEYDVDVALAPSAFAFQAVPPINNPFCSRDDSEIATRTICQTPDSFRRGSMRSPNANPMFLLDTYSTDDLDVGCQTGEKIRLRHMGSALSYRLSMSGTPDNSVFGDDEAYPSRQGHCRRYSDMSEKLGSFKERNKMIRLESIVGGMQKAEGSFIEFGVLDADQFMNMPTPRLCKSSSEQLMPSNKMPSEAVTPPTQLPPPVLLENRQIESYPLSFLDDILEEEEDWESADDIPTEQLDQKSISGDLDSMNEMTTSKHEVRKSTFRVAVKPIEIKEDDGFKNPAYGLDMEWPTPLDSAESVYRNEMDSTGKTESVPMLRIDSIRRSSSRKGKNTASTGDSVKPKRRNAKRDEALHMTLMERYLLQSVVDKYFVE